MAGMGHGPALLSTEANAAQVEQQKLSPLSKILNYKAVNRRNGDVFLFFTVVVARLSLERRQRADGLASAHAPHAPRAGGSHLFAGQLAGLLHPSGDLSFVELVVLVDVKIAHFFLLGLAGRDRTQRRAPKESHFDVLRKAMDPEEPALTLDPVKWRVPFDCLAYARDGAHDERVEAAPDIAFPARHGGDVGLYGSVAVGLRYLRVAA